MPQMFLDQIGMELKRGAQAVPAHFGRSDGKIRFDDRRDVGETPFLVASAGKTERFEAFGGPAANST